jgi:hypothetical protein
MGCDSVPWLMGTNVLEKPAASVLYLKTGAEGTTCQARGSHNRDHTDELVKSPLAEMCIIFISITQTCLLVNDLQCHTSSPGAQTFTLYN